MSPVLFATFYILGSCTGGYADEASDASTVIKITIDAKETFQTIEGFGACVVTYKEYPEEYGDPEFFDRGCL